MKNGGVIWPVLARKIGVSVRGLNRHLFGRLCLVFHLAKCQIANPAQQER